LIPTHSYTSLFFFFSSSGRHRALHSFPTRRSSDLGEHDVVLDRHALALELAARRALDRRLAVPRVVTVLLRAGPEENRHNAWYRDRKSTRLNSSHVAISYAVFCLKKKNNNNEDILC